MPAEQKRYLAYLLRLWQEERNSELAWRFSLENAHTGERQGFTELEQVYVYLEKIIGVDEHKPEIASN